MASTSTNTTTTTNNNNNNNNGSETPGGWRKYLPWIGAGFFVLLVLVLINHIMSKQHRDVGDEHIKTQSSCQRAWVNGREVLPSKEEQNACGADWSSLVTFDQRSDAAAYMDVYNHTIVNGGNTTPMVEHFAISTGATPTSNAAFNVEWASAYFNFLGSGGQYVEMVNGKVVDTNMTPEEVEELLNSRAAEEAAAEEARAAEAAVAEEERQEQIEYIMSHSGADIPEGAPQGIVAVGDKFVNFTPVGDIEVVEHKDMATPVGIINSKLTFIGGQRGLCFPFHESAEDNGTLSDASMSDINDHPCMDDDYTVTLGDDNSIMRIGGECFKYNLSGGLRLSGIGCDDDDALHVRIVNPNTISASSANGGLGEEEVSTGTE